MILFKKPLKASIRNTVIIFGISLIAYLLFSLASLYLARVMCATLFDAIGSCRGTNLQMASSMIVRDFVLLSRIATELSFIALTIQVIHRLVTKSAK